MMRLEDIGVVLDDKPILRSIHFVWEKGENIALLGPNGAGKSTLLKVMATLIKPTSGKLILPERISRNHWRQLIGAVFQETFLYGSLTAIENLQFYAKLYHHYDQNKIEELLSRVGLWEMRKERVDSFSKGMKQRLSLARALVHQPEYLLLDEPFDGLDMKSTEVISELFIDLKKEGVRWILVSHDIRQAWSYCDRAIVLYQGQLNQEIICNDQSYKTFFADYRAL